MRIRHLGAFKFFFFLGGGGHSLAQTGIVDPIVLKNHPTVIILSGLELSLMPRNFAKAKVLLLFFIIPLLHHFTI